LEKFGNTSSVQRLWYTCSPTGLLESKTLSTFILFISLSHEWMT
jgi:hypothetical protein